MAERDGSAAEKTPALSSLRLRVASFRTSPPALATAALGLALLFIAASFLLTQPDGKGGARAVSVVLAGPAAYHALPEFVADLKTSRAKAHFLQLVVVLEAPEQALAKVREEEARIISDVQTRLREFERQELAGSAGAERVRREVLAVIDRHVAPEKRRSVLFTKFLLD
jgi:flagellar basal body-associated protein FliL